MALWMRPDDPKRRRALLAAALQNCRRAARAYYLNAGNLRFKRQQTGPDRFDSADVINRLVGVRGRVNDEALSNR